MAGRLTLRKPEGTVIDWWPPRLAWVMWAVTATLLALQVVIWTRPPSMQLSLWSMPPSEFETLSLHQISLWVCCLIAATMGALIAALRPHNPIGWWLGVLALAFTGNVLGSTYAIYAFIRTPGGLPAGELALWAAVWCAVPMAIALIYVLLLFPTGRLLSSHCKPVIWVAIAGLLFSYLQRQFTPGPIATPLFSLATNPFAVSWVPSIAGRGEGGLLVYGACVALAMIAVSYRLLRARGVERQQLKWFAFGAVWLIPCVLLPVVLEQFGYVADNAFSSMPWVALYLILLLMLLSMTIGILQYRLFDIDVVINRTLVYGTVTALLAGAFAALSVVTQRLTLAMTGQESEAAVVLAALVVTALFQPLRARVQTLVDRRFYRSKYDVSRTLEQFANQVRDEVELEYLTSSLVGVVQETMQPAHASLWLRPRLSAPMADPPEPN